MDPNAILIDAPLDDYVDEHGWVRVDIAKTPEEAIEVLAGLIPLDDEDMAYTADGDKSWHHPLGELIGDGEIRAVLRDARCSFCGGTLTVRFIESFTARLPSITGSERDRYTSNMKVGGIFTPELAAMVDRLGGEVTTRDEPCEECYGTGKQGEFYYVGEDGEPWGPCDPHAEGASEYWNINVVEKGPQ